jgi:septum formation protein
MLFLASQSPRRRQLLEQLGLRFSVLDCAVDEVRAPGEPPEDYVRRVAREKAGAGLLQVAATRDAVVLAADTEVVLGDDVFGKPADAASAAAMLARLSGRAHRVLSAVCVADAGREREVLQETIVHFAPLDAAAIAAYVATGEPFGKAGAYAIQGRAAAFVSRVEGSYTGVMGLPLFETAQLLREFVATRAD